MSPEECKAYYELAKTCEVPGDIVECGVYNGDSLVSIALAMPNRRVWAYDSFEGFPAGNPEYDDEVALGLEGAVKGDVEEVAYALYGKCSELQIVKGWFNKTFTEGPLPEEIAFLSVDCDLYESVSLALYVLGPRVVPGGIITLDDWSCFIGCRRAFINWAKQMRQAPLLRTFGTGQVWWRVE